MGGGSWGRGGMGPLQVGLLDGPDWPGCLHELLGGCALWCGRLQYIVYPNSFAIKLVVSSFTIRLVFIVSSVVEVQQYQGISARSSVYFIIADQLPEPSWISDEYTIMALRAS